MSAQAQCAPTGAVAEAWERNAQRCAVHKHPAHAHSTPHSLLGALLISAPPHDWRIPTLSVPENASIRNSKTTKRLLTSSANALQLISQFDAVEIVFSPS